MNIDAETVRSVLQKSLKKLTALELLIFYLRIEKNLTLKEISQKICMSHEMVRLYLKRIYAVIKGDMEDENIS